jgi:hypothetical protein
MKKQASTVLRKLFPFIESSKPLDGANKYTIHFDEATIPPVNAFWSITLYDQWPRRKKRMV